ncbi:hypothetical protein [Nocardioides lijunqiniae]|uniref:hypothetical protein n=1 Tax=Nocardioides lijunqiniae TaxID=2760832 RepID=UPI0018782D58|nr:hypothetical protein [Nocardioides lijunqiniae]
MPPSPPRRTLGTAVLVVALGVLSSCGSGEERGADATETAPAPVGPTLQPAAAGPPAGTTRVSCDVTAASGPVRLALDLPSSFTERRGQGVACSWGTRVPMHDSDIDYSVDLLVSVEPVGAESSLSDVHAQQQPYEVEGDTPDGDDSILDLVLEEDVPTFGATVGDRLSWRCYCDGQDLITRLAQADGVRVTWSSVVPLTAETDAAFDLALAEAGTV